MLSLSHSFLFVHIPKTAGNSIQRVLLPYSEDKIAITDPHHDGVERFEVRSPRLEIDKHSPLAEYRRQLSETDFDRLFKFSCVRNPWDRCVSFFFSPHRGTVDWSPDTFREFIKNDVVPSHMYLELDDQDGDPFSNVDALIRYEWLTADFDEICHRIGITGLSLPKLNVSTHLDYRRYYPDDHLVELVAEKFAPEIGRFGYKFHH